MRIIIQDTKHLKVKQDLLWVGTATLVTVIIWVVYTVYVAFNKTTIDTSVEKLLTPLNPSLDQNALASVDDRFLPPEDFTVLVIKEENNDNRQVVPITQQTPQIPSSGSGVIAPLQTPTPLLTPSANQNLL